MARAFALGLALVAACAVPGCGDDAADADRGAARGPGADGDALPRPEGTRGSVTGMPASPGRGSVPIGGAVAADASADPALATAHVDVFDGTDPHAIPIGPDGLAAPAGARPRDDGTDAAALAEAAGAGPPTRAAPADPAVAANVVRDYYAAIGAGQRATAQALWVPGARGQAADELAATGAGGGRMTATIGGPGRVEGAAGSRFVRVPVVVESRQDDGSVRRFEGSYVLRQATADGATPAQREWRIEGAELREVGTPQPGQ